MCRRIVAYAETEQVRCQPSSDKWNVSVEVSRRRIRCIIIVLSAAQLKPCAAYTFAKHCTQTSQFKFMFITIGRAIVS
jgi:hypothetical protein